MKTFLAHVGRNRWLYFRVVPLFCIGLSVASLDEVGVDYSHGLIPLLLFIIILPIMLFFWILGGLCGRSHAAPPLSGAIWLILFHLARSFPHQA